MMSATFQNVQITNQVRISVSERIFQGITYTCLGGEVDHSIKLLTSEKLSHTFTIGQINFVKTEQGRLQ